ncbi:Maf family protein [Aurantiacibacter spongiae]|uniref:Nucleoside triphosphate pyrophosphatase n=1 Tax=Aurantiacibacter spongiae TaxID=2488860 RepID=A0A3N5D9T4_9SPHN|nr:Maf family protein [Aurantiacibacter spongiae]RPF71398.1 septum formation protein Maf [Aurantiacibacter spongiae]
MLSERIVLASRSASRQAMLRQAGVDFEGLPADVDERALEADMHGARPDQVALALAEAKALGVPAPGRLVLGSDSLVVLGDRRFDKPASRQEASEHLREFSGRVMQLHSAAAIARDGVIEWRHGTLATLTVRDLSDDFIASYLDAEWPAVGECVGVFRLEGPGVQLFERIEGDQFTVLGMPLLDVLGALRDLDALPS